MRATLFRSNSVHVHMGVPKCSIVQNVLSCLGVSIKGIDRRCGSRVLIIEVSIKGIATCRGIDRGYRSEVLIGGIDRVSIKGIDRGTP